MARRRCSRTLGLLCVLLCFAAAMQAMASPYHGQVTFNGLPVPGAIVTVTQGKSSLTTVTDALGNYSFPDVSDGAWTIQIEMTGFAAIQQAVTVAPNAPALQSALQLLPPGQLKADLESAVSPPSAPAPASETSGLPAKPATAPAPAPTPAPASDDELRERAADGLLINGSVNNGASSPFAMFPAFGNNRYAKGLYYGGIGATLSNSALDAKPYSITGLDTPKPQFSDLTGVVNFGGPLKVRHLVQNDPTFFIGYQWTRNHNDSTQSTFVPTEAERGGDFFQAVNANGQPIVIYNPATGQPFQNNTIPFGSISNQAKALLAFYP